MRRVVLLAALLPGFFPSGHTLVAGQGQSTLQSNLQAGRQAGRQAGGSSGGIAWQRVQLSSECLESCMQLAINQHEPINGQQVHLLPTASLHACHQHARLPKALPIPTRTRVCTRCWSRRRC